jgi:hypothetical protein
MKKLLYILLLTFSLSTLHVEQSTAQCAMCKRVAETSYQNENNPSIRRGKSLNKGILYLLSIPYLLGAVGTIVWYRNRKKD